MPQASNKITEFPSVSDDLDPVAALPANLLTQDRDPTREIRNLIEALQTAARDARRRQRQAEEERDQLRGKVLDLQEQVDCGAQSAAQLKALARERDMLLEQQSQYGPVISDLKLRLSSAESDVRDAVLERDSALREKKHSQRLVEDAERKCDEAQRQRDGAFRQRDLAKEELDSALEKAVVAKKNFTDAQKALAEARQALASTKKKGDDETAEQLVSLRQARDGMAVQIKELKKRSSEMEDEAAEATYAREAAEKLSRESQAQFADIQGVLEAAAAGGGPQKIEQLEAAILEMQNQLVEATEANRRSQAQVADIQGLLEAATAEGGPQKIEQLEAALLELHNQLIEATETNKTLADNEARLTGEAAALREELQASFSHQADENAPLLEEARASLLAAQKQIDAIIRDRDAIKAQLSANAIEIEKQLAERTAEVARLRQMLSDNDGKLSERSQLEVHFEKRRLDMIDLSTQLENAHRDIRNLSASLAEARLHAKLAGRPVPIPSPSAASEKRPAPVQEAGPGREEIMAMRQCFQTFSRDQKQLGMLGELETHALKISEQAVQDGRPILHRVAGAFASLLGDLLEVPDQITQATLRTLNQTIEFISLQVSDPEIEGCIQINDTRVYVVDDDPNTCATVVDALSLVGIQTNFALYSSAAVAELAANRYDLIILDVHLPELDGFELCSHIRNMALHADTPIFFITGDTSLENRVKSSLRGGNEFIGKPFSVQEIALKALKSVITGQLRKR
jgi:CheY-like chemotaxis protein